MHEKQDQGRNISRAYLEGKGTRNAIFIRFMSERANEVTNRKFEEENRSSINVVSPQNI